MNRITAEDVKAGMLVHDENGPETIMVTAVSVSVHSTQIYGQSIGYTPFTENGVALVKYSNTYINGDNGLWNLTV